MLIRFEDVLTSKSRVWLEFVDMCQHLAEHRKMKRYDQRSMLLSHHNHHNQQPLPATTTTTTTNRNLPVVCVCVCACVSTPTNTVDPRLGSLVFLLGCWIQARASLEGCWDGIGWLVEPQKTEKNTPKKDGLYKLTVGKGIEYSFKGWFLFDKKLGWGENAYDLFRWFAWNGEFWSWMYVNSWCQTDTEIVVSKE